MAGRVVRTKTEQTLVRIARPVAWSGSLTTASLVTPRSGRSRWGEWHSPRLLRRHPYTAMVEAMMSRRQSSAKPEGLSQLNLNAAGIDVGATSHFVAVPADRAEQPVREFEVFTADLYRLADWLAQCDVDTVVMESTGVYWIPLFGVLEGVDEANCPEVVEKAWCSGFPVMLNLKHGHQP